MINPFVITRRKSGNYGSKPPYLIHQTPGYAPQSRAHQYSPSRAICASHLAHTSPGGSRHRNSGRSTAATGLSTKSVAVPEEQIAADPSPGVFPIRVTFQRNEVPSPSAHLLSVTWSSGRSDAPSQIPLSKLFGGISRARGLQNFWRFDVKNAAAAHCVGKRVHFPLHGPFVRDKNLAVTITPVLESAGAPRADPSKVFPIQFLILLSETLSRRRSSYWSL